MSDLERMTSADDAHHSETPHSEPRGLSAPTGAEPELHAVPRPDGTAPRALVLGATGYIGGRLVRRLLNAGYRVRVLARTPQRIAAFAWGADVDVVSGNAADAQAVARAMADVDVVYYLVHSMSSGKDFARADQHIARAVAESASRAGVRRIVYLGGLAPEGVQLSPHLESRREVGEILLASGVPTLVLQAGVVIGSGSTSFEMIRHLTDVLPYMPAPRWVRNFIQPIAIRDVLYYLLAAPRVAESVSRAVDIGGPDVLRYGQMMNGYAVSAGLPQRRIAALPVLTPRLASHWVGLVTPVPRQLARPLVESLQHDCVMKNHDIDDIIPPPQGGLLDYRRSVELALGRIELDAIETSWLDAGVPMAPSDPLPSDPQWAGRTVYTDVRELQTSAPTDALWSVIAGIGGSNGWYSPPILWAIRGWADRAMGGVGMQRGRRNRSAVVVGDAIDFWRVEACEPGRLLRLRAEMKVPGRAWLELSCASVAEGGAGSSDADTEAVTRAGGDPTGIRSVYRQRAIFFPSGLRGRLYWWSVYPFHGIIFAGMARRITALAESEAAAPGRAR